MPRLRPDRSTCWDEPWHPVVLTRDPEVYCRLADVLDATAPPEWASLRASVVLGGPRGRICTVEPTCGSDSDPDEACLHAVHDAIMVVGSHCLSPAGMRWVGIWVDHDFTTGTMVATMMHGGRRPHSATPPQPSVPRALAHPATTK